MGKLLFKPVSIATGLLAGLIGARLFHQLWGLIDDEEPPGPEHRVAPWWKLMLALALEGAIFRMVRGLIDRSGRRGYYSLTGTWPGESRPDEA